MDVAQSYWTSEADALSGLATNTATYQKDLINRQVASGNAGIALATAINSATDFQGAIFHLPSVIMHFGQGAGAYAGDPSPMNAARAWGDVGTASSIALAGIGSAAAAPAAGAEAVGAEPAVVEVPMMKPGTLHGEEENAVADTVRHIDNGTEPEGTQHWGTAHKNRHGYLPGEAGAGGYQEYYVPKPPGCPTRWGPRRIVTHDESGNMYYSWTHYGEEGDPPFVRIR